MIYTAIIGGLIILLTRMGIQLIWKNKLPKMIEKLRWLIALLISMLFFTIVVLLKNSIGVVQREVTTGIGALVCITIASLLKNKTNDEKPNEI